MRDIDNWQHWYWKHYHIGNIQQERRTTCPEAPQQESCFFAGAVKTFFFRGHIWLLWGLFQLARDTRRRARQVTDRCQSIL